MFMLPTSEKTMTTTTLKNHRYASALVRHYNNGDMELRSYSTTVITVRDGWLTVNGLYSATTRKHIGYFVSEYGFGTYQTAKALYTNGYKMNIQTGEVKEA